MNIDFWGIFKDFVRILYSVLSPLIKLLVVSFVIFAVIVVFYYFYFRFIKKMKRVKPYYEVYHERNAFLKIFVDFPRQLVLDYFNHEPYDFEEYGIHMVCGTQGSGKTITAVYLLRKWKRIYPELKLYTNSALSFEDGELTHWKQLVKNNNGKKGVVNFIDETPVWFSNEESRNVPPEILGEISQQRKQRKAIVGTCQVFGKMSKPLREQTHFVYLPKTIAGCLTIVFKADPHTYDMENNKFKKKKFAFFFVHDKELREAYDTYKRISKYTKISFAPSLIAGSLATEVQETSK